MSKHGIILCLFLALTIVLPGCQATERRGPSLDLRVMSFNIRNGKARDGENAWEHRKPLVFEVIGKHGPDVVGLQEAYRFQMDALLENLPQYGEVGEGRDGGTRGEYSAILYRADRFEVGESGTFWLSDTPEVKSRHWGNRYLRICTWARLIDRSAGRAFYVFNTHLDHQSQPARIKSAKLIAERIAGRAHDDPVILTGDFNAGEDNIVIRYLKGAPDGDARSSVPMIDTYRQVHPDELIVGTGNGGYTGKSDGPKIDYVFVQPGARTLDASIDRMQRDGRYPSDHYPVTAHVRLRY